MMRFLPVFSTLAAFAFTAAVFNRYRYKQGPHLLFWGIGLFLYGLGTLSEVILALTFNELALKVWYISGAMLTAAWLGQGSIFLLVRKPGVAKALGAALAAASLLSIVLVLAAPVQGGESFDVLRPVSEQYKEMLTRSGLIVTLTIVLNIYGTLALVGGALYSAYLFWRKKVLAERMLGNLLIAGGAMLPAMAGSFIKAGLFDWLYLSELLGVLIMYGGFILATQSKPAEQKAGAARWVS